MNVTPPTPPLPTPLAATPVPPATPVPLAARPVTAKPVSPSQKGDQSTAGKGRRERPADPPAHPTRAIDLSV